MKRKGAGGEGSERGLEVKSFAEDVLRREVSSPAAGDTPVELVAC